jgi:hypothetical protein
MNKGLALFYDSGKRIIEATGSRTPGASTLLTSATHWLGYTNKVRLRGLSSSQGF